MTEGQPLPGPRSRRSFSGDQIETRQPGHGPERPARGRVHPQVDRRKAVRQLHRARPRQRVLRDRAGRNGRLRAAASRARSRRAAADHERRDRRLRRRGHEQPRDRPPLRLAAVPGRRRSATTQISADAGPGVPVADARSPAIIGIVLCPVFMLSYYRLPGVIAELRAHLLRARRPGRSSGSSR